MVTRSVIPATASSRIVPPDHRPQGADGCRARGRQRSRGGPPPGGDSRRQARKRERTAGQAAEDGVGTGLAGFVLRRITAHRHGLDPSRQRSA